MDINNKKFTENNIKINNELRNIHQNLNKYPIESKNINLELDSESGVKSFKKIIK